MHVGTIHDNTKMDQRKCYFYILKFEHMCEHYIDNPNILILQYKITIMVHSIFDLKERSKQLKNEQTSYLYTNKFIVQLIHGC
jgi:hypothetical protein